MPNLSCEFEVVKAQACPPMVWIQDLDRGAKSVTNDAEAVAVKKEQDVKVRRIQK